ncbi:MAG: class E sortase [Ilumatobacteraceae bacterium]
MLTTATLAFAGANPASAAGDATVTVPPASAAPGNTAEVQLHGFPTGPVEVSVCAGDGGSAGCAVRDAVVVTTDAAGSATATLTVVTPEEPCPCVVRATTLDSHVVATAPLDIAGAPTARPEPVAAPAPASLQVLGVELQAHGSLLDRAAEQLGFGGERALVVTVRNNGDVATTAGATIQLDGEATALGPVEVAAHGEATLRTTLRVPALSAGDVGVRGTVRIADASPLTADASTADTGKAADLPIGATTTSWPLALGIGPLLAGLFLLDRWWQRRRHRRIRVARLIVRAAAVTALVTAAVVGLHTARHVAATDTETAAAQRRLLTAFDQATSASASTGPAAQAAATGVSVRPGAFSGVGAVDTTAAPASGTMLGLLRIPKLDHGGTPYEFAFVEGVSPEALTAGPGHFPGSAMPGEIGNFALSGHRKTHLAPFGDLDELAPGDAIVVETATATFTYRVVRTDIVTPDRTDVLYPVPGDPAATPTEALVTLITCHPEHSTRERMVVVGQLEQADR